MCASGNGSGARFSAVWSTTDVPLARQWPMTGQGVAQLGFAVIARWWVIFDGRANALGLHSSTGLDVQIGGWLGSQGAGLATGAAAAAPRRSDSW